MALEEASNPAPVITHTDPSVIVQNGSQAGIAAHVDRLDQVQTANVPNEGESSQMIVHTTLPYVDQQQNSSVLESSHNVETLSQQQKLLPHVASILNSGSLVNSGDLSQGPQSSESVPKNIQNAYVPHRSAGTPLGDAVQEPCGSASEQSNTLTPLGIASHNTGGGPDTHRPEGESTSHSNMPPPAAVPQHHQAGASSTTVPHGDDTCANNGVVSRGCRFKAQEAREREERARRRLAAGLPAEDPATPTAGGAFILSPSVSITSGKF